MTTKATMTTKTIYDYDDSDNGDDHDDGDYVDDHDDESPLWVGLGLGV